MLERDRITTFFRRHAIKFILLLLFLVAAIASKDFRTPQNLVNLISRSSIVGILAIGQTVVLLTGGFDLSHGSYVALVSVLVAISMPFGMVPALLFSLVGLLALGFVNGFFVNRGITPFIMTLAMQGIARTLALVLSGANTVNVNNPAFSALAYREWAGIPICTYLWFALSALFSLFLNRTRTGRHIYAVGGNRESARLSGVNMKAITYTVFLISAFCALMAGLIYTSRLGVALPDSAIGYEMDGIASSIIGGVSLFGGVGNLSGTFCGVMIYSIITNILTILGVSTYWQQVVKGIIILSAVFINTMGGLKKRRGRAV